MPIRITAVHGDVLIAGADVLALKYAQYLYGVDSRVVSLLRQQGTALDARLPAAGSTLFVPAPNGVRATEVLFVGVEPVGRFDYESIRQFARQVLATLTTERPLTEHVAMTLHGAVFGLDEGEAFRAELAGLLDAIHEGQAPASLQKVSIVERDPQIAAKMGRLLEGLLPGGVVASSGRSDGQSLKAARSRFDSVGRESRDKPLVFVAMPFAEKYSDLFHYGITRAADAAGFLCERADLASFTGDVITWVKGRIDSASLVVADLTSANPNVYLEVGYAWGRGVSTVLVVAQGDELKFDVRAQRCLIYRSIQHLEELLTTELRQLRSQLPG